ncbi:MAG: SDR family oxidoreductase [Betaproteobacteria bacterium]|nr:SDR family oxidoreductase [Betaproteobacteria bacterium]
MRDLNGKVAWVTGAGTGIGEGAALALAGAGMTVVLSGRRKAELERVAAAIAKRGGRARVAPLDVSHADAVQAVVDGIVAIEGRIDVAVNSAGLNVQKRHWKHLSRADWDMVVRIDLDGVFYCCHALLPVMRAQKDGLIINISSWAGRHVGSVTGPAYHAAKFGVNALTETINIEQGLHGIRATAMCPGEVATPILDKRPIPVTPEQRAQLVQPEDCGETVLFLARLPAHVCINELTISPTLNRGYVAAARALPE